MASTADMLKKVVPGASCSICVSHLLGSQELP
jgi:hypothetical protein